MDNLHGTLLVGSLILLMLLLAEMLTNRPLALSQSRMSAALQQETQELCRVRLALNESYAALKAAGCAVGLLRAELDETAEERGKLAEVRLALTEMKRRAAASQLALERERDEARVGMRYLAAQLEQSKAAHRKLMTQMESVRIAVDDSTFLCSRSSA